jgi:glycosyltransferase involved in cell wall biosynthesis
MSKSRCLIFIVAYQAETTIAKVVSRIPAALSERYEIDVLIIDDSSKDRTFENSYELSKHSPIPFEIHALYNPTNQGYGGNQKLGYHFAIEQGYDFVALLHGDGQYAPECLPDLLEPLERGEAAAVFGSRMLTPKGALAGGMPLYKYFGNKILTWTQNLLLRSHLSEFHSGYRLYSVGALKRIPFEHNSNDFHFDTEIIIQLMIAGLRIVELPIPTFYGDEICRVDGIRYAANVIRTTLQARLQQYCLFYDRKFDCAPLSDPPCKLNFPSPQSFVADLIPAGSRVLDLAVDSNVETLPLDKYDFVLLLDVIEHMASPEAFLDRLRTRLSLNPQAELIVSTANVAFFVTRLMLLLGFFNYSKRGILDVTHTRLFTRSSLRSALEQAGFMVTETKTVPAPFPLALGENWISRTLLAVNSALIAVLPGLFGYQVIVRAKARPTVTSLLLSAHHASSVRSEAYETASSGR